MKSKYVIYAHCYCKRCALPVQEDHDCEAADAKAHARRFGPMDQLKAAESYLVALTADKMELRTKAIEVIRKLIDILDETGQSVEDKAYIAKVKKEWFPDNPQIAYLALDELPQFGGKPLHTMEAEAHTEYEKMMERNANLWKKKP